MKLKTLFVLLLAGSALAGCHRLDPNSPLAKRQAIFKQMLHASEDMGGMLRGRLVFDADKFRSDSLKLNELASQPWQYFPTAKPADEGGDTRAREEVWQRQLEFQADAKTFQQTVAALEANTRQATPTADGVRKDLAAVEDACEACHKKFRAL
ncbi:c-type cytochrome [Pseudomonas panipatensis]|uniref:Cytochrome c556 n=1 Tax=Pseudomonas panipatensis TaxID=428992 RepID=A0A1G8K762_9PSED|nr:cytochrome c [Pseudomonas panipatensis]SDI39278.1 Cytochrome c556 [Pseudomonas panipatensis]SMP60629.1 Cytochrome c556 [Pseudomonas panipatensis]